MDAAHQWVATTTGRTATDPYSWMQAIHWVSGSGLYKPTRTHGPAWGPTTVLIAQEISALSECRPGIDYLARKLDCSERTVQYHLGMLREAGLLAYRSKGTRLSGQPNQASVYERIIPTVFDTALGIRTTGEGLQRRPVGIAPESRTLIGKLAKKAARKIRKRRRRARTTPVSGGSLCTPMQGGTSASSPTGCNSLPSETSKLASGEADSPTPKTSKCGPRKLNRVGRRHQLARELMTLIPWLGGASPQRLAWIVRHVADAGWTALEVQAIAETMPLTARDVRRPSGMLAHRLKGVHLLFTTPQRRATAVAAWQESRTAEHARHAGYDEGITTSTANSAHVRRLTAEAFAQVRQGPVLPEPVDGSLCEIPAGAIPGIGTLTRDDVIEMRAAAQKDPGLIEFAIEGLGETEARRLYTSALVDQALASRSSNITLNPWMETSRA
ncbi:hypothetical protein HY68_36745 [Streptomyces sp. AcH 505]|uniref:helix-turn-helix domain-containing protein n=1 Tax=Streptomyces sp. AcH 505 TaxID=352211 RepID=UPI0005923E3B|nr:hypothetical protein HY68_36745 [Streptomyces sp. AcH 505]